VSYTAALREAFNSNVPMSGALSEAISLALADEARFGDDFADTLSYRIDEGGLHAEADRVVG
jgi:hypothetical protein